jgi:hypothetical protein
MICKSRAKRIAAGWLRQSRAVAARNPAAADEQIYEDSKARPKRSAIPAAEIELRASHSEGCITAKPSIPSAQ